MLGNSVTGWGEWQVAVRADARVARHHFRSVSDIRHGAVDEAW